MAFQFNQQYSKRLNYSPNGTDVFRLPAANLYASFDALLVAKVNILTTASSNLPDYQIFNLIDNISLMQDVKNAVWSLSGQALALMFTNDLRFGGVAAAGNKTIPGTVANAVSGQHYLHCPFYPQNAPNPGEFAVDTRYHTYDLVIKWKDATAASSLFGTIGSSVTVTANTDIYLDIQLNKLGLIPNPQTGAPDILTNIKPLVVGIQEQRIGITQANSKFDIALPKFDSYRKVLLYTTDQANTDQELGVNSVISGDVMLMNSQNQTFNDVLVTMLSQRTSQTWGQGANINAGLYDFDFLAFGSVMDVLVTNTVNDMFLRLNVTPGTNAYVRPIMITQETQ